MTQIFDYDWVRIACPRCLQWVTGESEPMCVRCGGSGFVEMRRVAGRLESKSRSSLNEIGERAVHRSGRTPRTPLLTPNKFVTYRLKCAADRRCPHCGKPCGPYYECEERRAYKRQRYRATKVYTKGPYTPALFDSRRQPRRPAAQ